MNSFALSVNVGLGMLLIASYVYFAMENKKKVNKLWGNIKGVKRKITIASIFITTLFYLFTIYYIIFKTNSLDQEKVKNIVLYQAILILASMLWMPLTIRYMKNKNAIIKSIVILVLFTVAIASFGNFFKVSKIIVPKKEKYLKLISILGAFYLFFHTFVLDFLLWNYNFF